MGAFERIWRAVAAVTGYERHVQLRTEHGRVDTPRSYEDLALPERLEYAREHRTRVIEEYEEFSIAHIEFDDQGLFWDRKQLDTFRDYVKSSRAAEDGALFVVFAHGWNNNARYDNANLRSLRAVLSNLRDTEMRLSRKFRWPQRKIIGIYLSWRGAASRIPLVKRFSFWSRKATAHRIGRGSMLEALCFIDQVYRELAQPTYSRLIILGHSFGAAAVFSAISHHIKTVAMQRVAKHELTGQPVEEKIGGFGNSVILVNPAFEALLYQDLDRVNRKVHYPLDQHVVLLTVSAKSDWANRIAFPVGQFLGRCLQRARKHTRRKMFTACGNVEKFHTHILQPSGSTGPVDVVCDGPNEQFQGWDSPAINLNDPAAVEPVLDDWRGFLPQHRRWAIREQQAIAKPHPFMLVQSTGSLIRGHNGFFCNVFIEFLRDFLIAQDVRIQEVEKSRERQATHR